MDMPPIAHSSSPMAFGRKIADGYTLSHRPDERSANMNDTEKIISGYLSIADMLMRMKETSLIEDPMVISQLKELQIAMADLVVVNSSRTRR
ncbi:hypothetical protein BKM09_024415 [Pseudomonas amygdali pv. morsprunorum]|nr:hypothetical protein BKM09_024415 [Pseudomonas amygdali pv. morsprunorum]